MRHFLQLESEETRNSLLRLQAALLRKIEEIIVTASLLDDNDNNLNSKGLGAVILNSIGLPENSARYIIREILQLNREDTREIFICKFNKFNGFIAVLIENIDIFIEHVLYVSENINNNTSRYINVNIRIACLERDIVSANREILLQCNG